MFRCTQMIHLDAKRYAYSKPASAEATHILQRAGIARELAALHAVTAAMLGRIRHDLGSLVGNDALRCVGL